MDYSPNSQSYYTDARSKAKKRYNAQKGKGESGHLPSLDGVLKDVEIVATVELGTFEIPLNKIVGTYYHARRMIFAKNFLPLESVQTEFGQKWINLCDAHLTTGIRDPIKVYEYLNFYYVMEGNKRVSVLKYFDAVKVTAEVHRLIPRYDEEDETVKLYYAFLDFYAETKLVDIWLTKAARYDRLLRYLKAYEPESSYYDSKYDHFLRYVYMPFRKMYLEAGGQNLAGTTGDAFTLYAKFYGIPQELDQEHVREVMPRLMSEITPYTSEEDNEVEVLEDETSIKPKTIFGTLATTLSSKKVKIGFVYARTIASSGWTYSHELGRQHIEKRYGEHVTTGFIDLVPEDKRAYEVIKAFASDGYDVIFTTSEVFKRATISCAIEMPNIKFFNCSGSKPYVNMSNYFGRTYEPRFLTGIIAGAMTKSNIIGYTATERNPEVVSCINAFTIGARMVNPDAVVKVLWTGEWNNPKVTTDLSEELIGAGADVISNKNLIVPRDITKAYGVYAMLCDIDADTKKPNHYLAAPIWNWGIFYEKIVGSILSGGYQRVVAQKEQNKRLVNFWWGMESGVLDLYYSKTHLPKQTARLVEAMKKMIQTDQLDPFEGPIIDSEGNVRVTPDETLSADEILHMDWFVEGVELSNPE